MLPGLSITIYSCSLSSCRILTGLDVIGGSCQWTMFSMRCTMVSDFATLPLTAVTPDSSAYICEGAHVRVRMPSQQHYPTKAKRMGVTLTQYSTEQSRNLVETISSISRFSQQPLAIVV